MIGLSESSEVCLAMVLGMYVGLAPRKHQERMIERSLVDR